MPGPGGRRRRRRAGPVLSQGRCRQRVQFGPRIKRQQLAGHVALHLGSCPVGRQIHRARHGVGDGLVRFGPRVEIQQCRDDLAVDLAAVVVAGKGRGDGRGHGGRRGVVGQLARHEARDLRLVPVGHQLAGDEGQHLHLGPVLAQVEGVDGSGDRCTRLRLRVGFAAGVAVRLSQDGVVQVLVGGAQRPGHRQVAQHIAAPQQVEGGPAVPGLAVVQRERHQRRRDGGVSRLES